MDKIAAETGKHVLTLTFHIKALNIQFLLLPYSIVQANSFYLDYDMAISVAGTLVSSRLD